MPDVRKRGSTGAGGARYTGGMIRLTPDEARRYLVARCGLATAVHPPGAAGVRALLAARRCIQLDPIDRIGTNADLVAFARVDGLARGDVHRHLEGHAFEHYAKMRCLLPARLFPAYRGRVARDPGWMVAHREKRLPSGALDAVLAEVEARGPLTPAEMGDHGAVEAIDYSGWKGTGKAATMALRVLAMQCRLVVRGRRRGSHLYDLPHRALPPPHVAAPPPGDDGPELLDRVEAAALLPEVDGPWWFALRQTRGDGTVDRLLAEGRLERVVVDGARRTYLAPGGFRDRPEPEPDDRMRILGPLDPLLWYRPLVQHAFGFEYLWEVYKPAEQRRWGYYVCPLLHRGRLVGRFEGRFAGGEVVVERRWIDDPARFDEAAFDAAIERHAACLSRPVSAGR